MADKITIKRMKVKQQTLYKVEISIQSEQNTKNVQVPTAANNNVLKTLTFSIVSN